MTNPAGWRAVPVEPTAEMAKAGEGAIEGGRYAEGVWHEMLAAAPSPPSAEPLPDEREKFEAWVTTLPATMQAGMTSSTLARMAWMARAQQPSPPPSERIKELCDNLQVINVEWDSLAPGALLARVRNAREQAVALMAFAAAPPSDALREARDYIQREVDSRHKPYEQDFYAALQTLLAAPSAGSAGQADQFAAADAELHAVLPPNVSHQVLETMPPLPKEWSAQVICGKVLAYGKSKVSPQMALAIGVINFLTEYQKGQPVDQQARRHANTLLNCLAGFDANPHPGSKADLARQWLRALAYPETQEPT